MRTRVRKALGMACIGLLAASAPGWAAPRAGQPVAGWLAQAGEWLEEMLAGWRPGPAERASGTVATSRAGKVVGGGKDGDLGHEIDPNGAAASTADTDRGHEIDPDG